MPFILRHLIFISDTGQITFNEENMTPTKKLVVVLFFFFFEKKIKFYNKNTFPMRILNSVTLRNIIKIRRQERPVVTTFTPYKGYLTYYQ